MDKIIHRHLDNRMDIQESATKMVEEALDSINLRKIIKNPKAELSRVGHIALGVAEAHARDAVDEGVRFAKEARAKGPVLLQKSDDPKLNEGDLQK